MSAFELAAYLEKQGAKAVPCMGIQEGIKRALAALEPTDVMCTCGSLHMVGEVRRFLGV